MGPRNPLQTFSLKGRTENITHIADVISDSYCIGSEVNGFEKYRKRFFKTKKTPKEVVEAIILLQKNNLLGFGQYGEDCRRIIRNYIQQSCPAESHNDLLSYFKIVEKVGVLLDSTKEGGSKWFTSRSRIHQTYLAAGLVSQYVLLKYMLDSKSRGNSTVEWVIVSMFSALELSDPQAKKFRDQFVGHFMQRNECSEALLVAYLEIKEAMHLKFTTT